jgi:hypothetical protein
MRWLAVSTLLVLCVLLPGCAGVRKVKITGKVHNNGQPLKITDGKGLIRVTLLTDVPQGQPYDTFFGESRTDGSFEIPDVPVGKYKIGIEHLDPSPQEDQLQGKFSPQNTPIRRELDGKEPLNLDVSKPNG